jgi:hypothetical protein
MSNCRRTGSLVFGSLLLTAVLACDGPRETTPPKTPEQDDGETVDMGRLIGTYIVNESEGERKYRGKTADIWR